MSPVRLSVLALAVLAAASLVPPSGADTVPQLVTGEGVVLALHIEGLGRPVDGGLFDWNDVCGACQIRFATASNGFTAVGPLASSEPVKELPPGLYEVRDFRGFLGYNVEGRNAFYVLLHGTGEVERLG